MPINISSDSLIPAGFGSYVKSMQAQASAFKRFVVGTEIWFNMAMTVKGVTYPAKSPSGKKLLVYSSYNDLTAKKNPVSIDVSKGVKMSVQLFDNVLTTLSTTSNPSQFIQQNAFNVKLFWDNKMYWYRYEPKDGLFMFSSSTDALTAEKAKALARLESSINALGTQANNNARKLAALSKMKNVSSAQLSSFVSNHNTIVEAYKKNTPKELRVILNKSSLNQISGVGVIGAIPVIVWWVAAALVGLGLAVWGIAEINRQDELTKRTTDRLKAEQVNIDKAIQIAMSSLPQNEKDKILDLIDKSNNSLHNQNEKEAANSSSFFSDAKGLITFAAGAYLVVKVLPDLFNKKAP